MGLWKIEIRDMYQQVSKYADTYITLTTGQILVCFLNTSLSKTLVCLQKQPRDQGPGECRNFINLT